MKKIILTILLLGLLALVISPYFVGRFAEKQFLKFQNKLTEKGADIEISYSRGFFSSKADSEVNLFNLIACFANEQKIDFLRPLTSCVIQTEHLLKHGPVVFGGAKNQSKFKMPVVATVLNQTTIKELKDRNNQPFNLESSSIMGVSGVDNNLRLDAGSYAIENADAILSYEDISVDFNLPYDCQKYDFSIISPKICISNATDFIAFSNVAGFSKAKIDQPIPIGNVGLSLGSVTFDIEDKQGSLNTFSVLSKTTESKHSLLNYSTALSLESIKFDQDSFGPAILEFDWRRVDIQAFVNLQKTLLELKKQSSDGSSVNTFLLIGQLASAIPPLLSSSPELEISKFEVSSEDGIFSGSALLSFAPCDNIMDMQAVASCLAATINLSLPAKFVEENFSDNPEAMKLLQKKGDNYTITAEYKAGKLTVNGEDYPLPFSGLL